MLLASFHQEALRSRVRCQLKPSLFIQIPPTLPHSTLPYFQAIGDRQERGAGCLAVMRAVAYSPVQLMRCTVALPFNRSHTLLPHKQLPSLGPPPRVHLGWGVECEHLPNKSGLGILPDLQVIPPLHPRLAELGGTWLVLAMADFVCLCHKLLRVIQWPSGRQLNTGRRHRMKSQRYSSIQAGNEHRLFDHGFIFG